MVDLNTRAHAPAVAIVWSYGRASLCELLGMWARQTVQIPLLVWLDGINTPHEPVPNVRFAYAPRLTHGRSLAPMRRASIALARSTWNLGPDDAFLVLEDDDYYSPRHVERTLAGMGSAQWTGALRVGVQWQQGATPELCESIYGPGQHAAWAMRLGLYDQAGGYRDVEGDDVELARAIGWARCKSHTSLTHVRRQCGAGLSSLGYDVEKTRTAAPLAERIEPKWSEELDGLAAWCAERA